ncbi:hypothetical protein QFC22_001275 [Naganishia vaughanmartiniae]|uniref:Uncharacterized protein n=1 Tax=Naganishia vaughanmartiniae TaxID=1424756 RepID=A0ACC2XGC8_9TREE|nr:hypothetical protein QFC22_001275 [Naganishia vaughanmartiniae]
MPEPVPVPKSLSVAIVGGGMGGLAAAVALGRAGVKVDLFEQAPKFEEVGAGIKYVDLDLGPNTVRTLEQMGLGDEYNSVAETDDSGLFFQWWDGIKIRKAGETYTKYPRSAVHRARLLEVLHKSLPESVTVHLGVRVHSVENVVDDDGNDKEGKARIFYTVSKPPAAGPLPPLNGGAALDTPSATTGPQETHFDADVIIGADGIKSVLRTTLQPPAPSEAGSAGGKPSTQRYTGTYCYRALVPMDKAKALDDEQRGWDAARPKMVFGPGRHLTIFPIEKGQVLNIVAFVSDRSLPKDERTWEGPWLKKVDKETIQADFAGWDEYPRKLLGLISEKDQIQWALHEVLSPSTWRNGRITLLGDAAHASLPHNGSGASMAIEDAYVLSGLLAMPQCNARNVEQFLQVYEDVRRPRGLKQQLHACETGEMFEYATEKWGNDTDAIAQEMLTRTDWIWDYNIENDMKDARELLAKRKLI